VFLIGFPLLIIPLAIYNMIAFLTPGILWTDRVTSVRLFSGADWVVTFGDILIGIALLLLFIEIAKATRAGAKSIVDHVLSIVILLAAIGEFNVLPQAATSTFALLTAICLIDVLGGFAIAMGLPRHEPPAPPAAVVAPAPTVAIEKIEKVEA
jgi:hypothetical protein